MKPWPGTDITHTMIKYPEYIVGRIGNYYKKKRGEREIKSWLFRINYFFLIIINKTLFTISFHRTYFCLLLYGTIVVRASLVSAKMGLKYLPGF